MRKELWTLYVTGAVHRRMMGGGSSGGGGGNIRSNNLDIIIKHYGRRTGHTQATTHTHTHTHTNSGSETGDDDDDDNDDDDDSEELELEGEELEALEEALAARRWKNQSEES